MLHKSLFSRSATAMRTLNHRCAMFKQTSLLGQMQAANFAKYDRNKPHLNVGTIGKYNQKWNIF